MLLYEKEIGIPVLGNNGGLLTYLRDAVLSQMKKGEAPVRFVVTQSNEKKFHCEMGILSHTAPIIDNPQAPVDPLRSAP